MGIRQRTVAGIPAVGLTTHDLELLATPAEGGRLVHLRRRRGREWLRQAEPAPAESEDPAGGWTEWLSAVERPGAAPWEIAGARWDASAHEDAEGVTLTVQVRSGPVLTWRREVTLEHSGPVVRVRHELTNQGSAPVAFHWHSRIDLLTQPGARLALPVEHLQVTAVRGRGDLGSGDRLRWPPPAPPSGSGEWRLTAWAPWPSGGLVVLADRSSGERLEVEPGEGLGLGIDLGRRDRSRADGASWDRLALLPSVGDPALPGSPAARRGPGSALGPGERRAWGFRLRLPDPD